MQKTPKHIFRSFKKNGRGFCSLVVKGSAAITDNLQLTVWEKVFWPHCAASLPHPQRVAHSGERLSFIKRALGF